MTLNINVNKKNKCLNIFFVQWLSLHAHLFDSITPLHMHSPFSFFFNSIKCLHVLWIGLERNKPPLSIRSSIPFG